MLTPLNMLTLGQQTAVQLLQQGKLNHRSAWWAIKGGWRYLAAIARGDVRDDAKARECVGKCITCPARTTRNIELEDGRSIVAHYCGPAFEDRTKEPVGPTCGCLVAITVRGAFSVNPPENKSETEAQADILPAGKTLVASERCPRGLY